MSTSSKDTAQDKKASRYEDLDGKIFNDRYLIHERIGGGGNAGVYRATQLNTEREVALKVFCRMNKQLTNQLEYLIKREIKITSHLKSPYTARVFDADTADLGEDGRYLYMVQELIDGVTLHSHIHRHGPISQLELVRFMQDILASLREAHELKYVHRDLKPANIMVTRSTTNPGRHEIKVLDYGIAKPFEPTLDDDPDDEERYKTSMIEINGTVMYMAPEQVQKQQFDLHPGIDLYALGMVCWECLLGRYPLTTNTKELLYSLSLPVDSPSLELPEHLAQSELRNLINKLLKRNPEERYKTCQEVLNDLENLGFSEAEDEDPGISYSDRETKKQSVEAQERVLSDASIEARDGDEEDAPSSVTSTVEVSRPEDETQRKKEILLVALGLLFIILGAVYVLHTKESVTPDKSSVEEAPGVLTTITPPPGDEQDPKKEEHPEGLSFDDLEQDMAADSGPAPVITQKAPKPDRTEKKVVSKPPSKKTNASRQDTQKPVPEKEVTPKTPERVEAPPKQAEPKEDATLKKEYKAPSFNDWTN